MSFESHIREPTGAIQAAAWPSKQNGLATATMVVRNKMELQPSNVQELSQSLGHQMKGNWIGTVAVGIEILKGKAI